MAIATGFVERDRRHSLAYKCVTEMLTDEDLKGYWLYDPKQECSIAVFASPSITDFFTEVGYSPAAADVIAAELERAYEADIKSGYTMFGKALHDYAEGLGIVEIAQNVEGASDQAIMLPTRADNRPILEPDSDGALLQELGLRWVKEGQNADLYVLQRGTYPANYDNVRGAPKFSLRTKAYPPCI